MLYALCGSLSPAAPSSALRLPWEEAPCGPGHWVVERSGPLASCFWLLWRVLQCPCCWPGAHTAVHSPGFQSSSINPLMGPAFSCPDRLIAVSSHFIVMTSLPCQSAAITPLQKWALKSRVSCGGDLGQGCPTRDTIRAMFTPTCGVVRMQG